MLVPYLLIGAATAAVIALIATFGTLALSVRRSAHTLAEVAEDLRSRKRSLRAHAERAWCHVVQAGREIAALRRSVKS